MPSFYNPHFLARAVADGYPLMLVFQPLKIQCQLQHPNNIRSVLVDPRTVVLADHIPVGMPHLLGDPVDRGHSGSQQLTGVGMPALARPSIANPGREQVSLEETPGLQGPRLRKSAADGVFDFGTVRTRCESVTAQHNSKTAVRSSPCGFPVFCGIAQHHHEFPGCQYRFRGREKRQNEWRMAIFSEVGWEKGNFSKRGIKTGQSPCRSWLSPITSEGNLR